MEVSHLKPARLCTQQRVETQRAPAVSVAAARPQECGKKVSRVFPSLSLAGLAPAAGKVPYRQWQLLSSAARISWDVMVLS